MRISSFVRHLPLLFAITSPALLLAQFQKPTDEELKMTADPKAPGRGRRLPQRRRGRQRSDPFPERLRAHQGAQEKGKELATVDLPYLHGNFKIQDIKAPHHSL
jgi:hypothetical protein